MDSMSLSTDVDIELIACDRLHRMVLEGGKRGLKSGVCMARCRNRRDAFVDFLHAFFGSVFHSGCGWTDFLVTMRF